MTTLDEILARLNDGVKRDPAAMTALVEHRVVANVALTQHEHFIFWQPSPGEPPALGLLGLLNGLLFDVGLLAAIFNATGQLTGFTLLTDKTEQQPGYHPDVASALYELIVRDMLRDASCFVRVGLGGDKVNFEVRDKSGRSRTFLMNVVEVNPATNQPTPIAPRAGRESIANEGGEAAVADASGTTVASA